LFKNKENITKSNKTNISRKKMSKFSTRKTSDFYIFKTKRDKIIELLLNEITFLDQCFYKTHSYEAREIVKISLEMLENLLKIQGYISEDLTDHDYQSLKEFIYQTIKKTLKNIEEDALSK